VSVGDYDYEDEFPAVSQDAKDFIDGLLLRNPKYVGGVDVGGGGGKRRCGCEGVVWQCMETWRIL